MKIRRTEMSSSLAGNYRLPATNPFTNVCKRLQSLFKDKIFLCQAERSKAPLKQILNQNIHTENGCITIPAFIPQSHLSIPKGPTHVVFTGIFSYLDLGSCKHPIVTDSVTVPLDDQIRDVRLQVPVNQAVGISLYLLHIKFKQEVNGVKYDLGNKEGSAMGIVGVS